MILLYAILFILFESVGEGLVKRLIPYTIFSRFLFKNWFQWLMAITLFGIWFIIALNFDDYYVPILKLILGYIFVRFGIFDLSYNLAAGNEWNYYGDKKTYDKIMKRFGGFGWFAKFLVFLPMGIVFLMGWF